MRWEQLLRGLLAAEVPADALLGEEFGRLGESDRLWILDPIDGTSFFARHDPNWRVHMALEVVEDAIVDALDEGSRWRPRRRMVPAACGVRPEPSLALK